MTHVMIFTKQPTSTSIISDTDVRVLRNKSTFKVKKPQIECFISQLLLVSLRESGQRDKVIIVINIIVITHNAVKITPLKYNVILSRQSGL